MTALGIPHRAFILLVLLLTLPAPPAGGHDASAWGGLFRSRDHGATWVSANRGPFQSGAIALAISPADPDHLLLGAESGLFRSRNGGRDWTVEAPSVVLGAVFAVTFAADGRRMLAATAAGLFRGGPDSNWQEITIPRGTAPARAILPGHMIGQVYLSGWNGLYHSDDWGTTWSNAGGGLPKAPVTAFLIKPGTPDTLIVSVQGGLWISIDGARTWTSRAAIRADALALDLQHPDQLWAAAGGQLSRSSDAGVSWQHSGQPLPEPNTRVKAIIADDEALVATTDRGLYRSGDGGRSWALITDTLPPHLEAGPLLRDPVDPDSLYAGFTLIPYPELWRRAASQEPAGGQLGVTELVEAAVFLLLVILAAFMAVRSLRSHYRPSPSSFSHHETPR